MGSWFPYSFQSMPVVRNCIIAAVALFLLHWFVYPLRGPLEEWLSFRAAPNDLSWLRAWTWLTYAFLVLSPIGLLIDGLWLYRVGGTLERSWGSINFAAVFAALTAIAALAMVPAVYLFHIQMSLAGTWIPLVALFVAWAALDPELELCILFITLRLKVWAMLAVLLLYFGYGYGYGAVGPIVGLFALAAPAAAFYYVRKLPRLNLDPGFFRGGFSRGGSARPGFRDRVPPRPRTLLREEPPERERVSGFNPLRRKQEQEEIERLKKLLGDDDDGRPAGRR